VVWAGPGAEAGRPQLAQFGAEKVYAADSLDFDGYAIAPTAEFLARLVAEKTPATVLIAATTQGKEIARRRAVNVTA
jgi:electron transfer flavoprotein alpha subunit